MSKKITIIGAGVVGLTCAWRLAHAGWQVKVLDKDTVASGASGAALGALVPYGFNRVDATPTFQHSSLAMWPQFAAEISMESGIDVQFRPIPRLQFLENEDQITHAQKSVAASKGVQKIISATEAIKMVPSATPPTCGAVLCHATAHFSVPHFMPALHKACLKLGVEIQENEEVSNLAPLLQKNKVLVAAGAFSNGLHPALAQTYPVVPVKGQAVRLRPTQPLPNVMVRGKSFYIIPMQNGEVLVGNTTEPDAGFDLTLTPHASQQMLAKASAIFPLLVGAKLVGHWAGLRPKSATGAPHIGMVDGVPNLYVATGLHGIGFCMAPKVAEKMAETLGA